MPFEIGQSINSIADWFVSAPIVDTIARNPIYTALMITFIIVLIVMFVFRDADCDDSLLNMCLRTGFYVFIFLTGAILLHNRVLMKETQATVNNSEMADIFRQGYSGTGVGEGTSLDDSIVRVPIKYDPTAAAMYQQMNVQNNPFGMSTPYMAQPPQIPQPSQH